MRAFYAALVLCCCALPAYAEPLPPPPVFRFDAPAEPAPHLWACFDDGDLYANATNAASRGASPAATSSSLAPASTNAAPTSVNAGADQSGVCARQAKAISCSASDDGNPNPPGALSYTWSKTAGAGTCTFADASAASTTVYCDTVSTAYTIQCSASDSVLASTDTLTFTTSGELAWEGHLEYCPADAETE